MQKSLELQSSLSSVEQHFGWTDEQQPTSSQKQSSTTTESMTNVLAQNSQEQMLNGITTQHLVGSLKESSRQMISSLLSLGKLWIADSVVYLKAKMSTFAQSAVVCMVRISRVTSRAKEYMLQTISTRWSNIRSKMSGSISWWETLSSYPSMIVRIQRKHSLDGIFDIQCLTVDWMLVTVSQHELDLVTRISQVLRLDGIHILNCEQILEAYGKVSGTQLVTKRLDSMTHASTEQQDPHSIRIQKQPSYQRQMPRMKWINLNEASDPITSLITPLAR